MKKPITDLANASGGCQPDCDGKLFRSAKAVSTNPGQLRRSDPCREPGIDFQASKSGRTGTLTANPNPIKVCDGSGSGVTTVSWTVSSTGAVEVHINGPDGPLFSRAGGDGQSTTGKWVTDGMVFYLQITLWRLPASGSLQPGASSRIGRLSSLRRTLAAGRVDSSQHTLDSAEGCGRGFRQCRASESYSENCERLYAVLRSFHHSLA
jgi:hypothetical protein